MDWKPVCKIGIAQSILGGEGFESLLMRVLLSAGSQGGTGFRCSRVARATGRTAGDS